MVRFPFWFNRFFLESAAFLRTISTFFPTKMVRTISPSAWASCSLPILPFPELRPPPVFSVKTIHNEENPPIFSSITIFSRRRPSPVSFFPPSILIHYSPGIRLFRSRAGKEKIIRSHFSPLLESARVFFPFFQQFFSRPFVAQYSVRLPCRRS